MNRILFTLIYITVLTISFNAYAVDSKILDALLPGTKNCNYVDSKLYQPFSGIDRTFPGAATLGVTKGADGTTDCIQVGGSATTESLIKIAFTTLIAIVIVMTVISISISGIQYMTEEAMGSMKGKAKKRLQNSFIALGLALLSYSIVYTINKQLIEFEFNPNKLDDKNNIQKGIDQANAAKAEGSVYVADNAVQYLTQPVQQNGGYGTTPGTITPGSSPSWAATTATGNFSTNASYGSISCVNGLCAASFPTIFGYLDGNGRTGSKGDNGVGNSKWSDKPGCTYYNWNTTSMGLALPQGFWRAAGIDMSVVKYIGIRLYVNGVFQNILPIVDDSSENLDFTFAAAKAYLDPNIVNSDNMNKGNKKVTFEIVMNYYKNNPGAKNVVYIKDTAAMNGKSHSQMVDQNLIQPCGI
jgi:hypothetical protein